MRNLFLIAALLMTSFLGAQNCLDNVESTWMNELARDFATWQSYSDQLRGSIRTINQDTSVARVAEIRYDKGDSVAGVTYMFLYDQLMGYSIDYKEGKRPSVETMCEIWGKCTDLGGVVTWRSRNGKIDAFYWRNDAYVNSIVVMFNYGGELTPVFKLANTR